jgi:hypothetical protein
MCIAKEITLENFDAIKKKFDPKPLWINDKMPELFDSITEMKNHRTNKRAYLSVNSFDREAYLISEDVEGNKYNVFSFCAWELLSDNYDFTH